MCSFSRVKRSKSAVPLMTEAAAAQGDGVAFRQKTRSAIERAFQRTAELAAHMDSVEKRLRRQETALGRSFVPKKFRPAARFVPLCSLEETQRGVCGLAKGFATQAVSAGWSEAVDVVVAIVLEDAWERKDHIRAELLRVGAAHHSVLYLVPRHPRRSSFGIWDSHRLVAMVSRRVGLRAVAVFEDDAWFCPGQPTSVSAATVGEAVRECVGALPPDAAVLYLGALPVLLGETSAVLAGGSEPAAVRGTALHIRHVKINVATHAYVGLGRFMEFIEEHPPFATGVCSALARCVGADHFDLRLNALAGRYQISPMFFVQRNSGAGALGTTNRKQFNFIDRLLTPQAMWRAERAQDGACACAARLLLDPQCKPLLVAVFVFVVVMCSLLFFRRASREERGRVSKDAR